jgi:hypothetical protein
MPEPKKIRQTNYWILTKTLKDLCKNGMEAMQSMYYSYNILAFFERKLRFLCNAAWIMAIIKNNSHQPPLCNHSKPRLDIVQTGFVF